MTYDHLTSLLPCCVHHAGMRVTVRPLNLHGHHRHVGGQTQGVEYIGYGQETGTLRSHLFCKSPQILECTWEVSGDTLTIWYGEQGSPARYVGTFNEDRTTNTGAWEWPGGGYQSTMIRL
ncbi:hypothetical protein AB0B45_20545 [Nonomuraea sp. NPDC049152]|uniref:hypothetical protein n=1 Tax=Nonomuraea sp. NPDC049152 TaxID=3154350 RepID=UPI0034001F2B